MNNKYRKALNNIAIPLAETDFVAEHIEDFKMLEELVERETPVKYISVCGFPSCPKCFNKFPRWHEDYCPMCGQKIDWGNEK